MSPKPLLPWLLLAVFLGACAPTHEARRPEGPPPRALFQSSLALLLAHHEELRLTTDQMIAVGQREEALQARNRPLREKLREAGPPMPRRPPPGDLPPPPGVGGWGGNNRGWSETSSGAPPPGSGVPREEVPKESEEEREKRMQQVRALLRELDSNETAAYEDTEKLLDDTQKARARELVTQQREERKRVREALYGPVPPAAPPET